MKKRIILVGLLSLGFLAGCSNNASATSQTTAKQTTTKTTTTARATTAATTTAKPSTALDPATHDHEWVAGTKTGKVTKETCACGLTAYRVDVEEAEGWNKADVKMNGKKSPDDKSTWAISGIAAGKYDVQFSAQMSYSSHSDRYWYNMHETDTAQTPDKEEESPFRYFISFGENGTAINPTATDTWGEEGLTASETNYVTVITNVTVAGNETILNLHHGNIGYSLIIDHVRLIKRS